MRKNKLWAAAGVLLFAFTLSCTNDQKKGDTSDQKKDDPSQSKQADSQISPSGDTLSAFEADSIVDKSLASKTHTFPIKKDSTVVFCGKLNNPQDKIRLRFTVYYSKGGGALKKQAMMKLKGDDTFKFKFTAPADGKMHLVIEEERALTWKNLPLSLQPTKPDPCCELPPNPKKAAKRKTVGTKGETGDGGSSDIYQ